MTIDEIDLRILDMLQRNGKLSQAKIAGAVGLTTLGPTSASKDGAPRMIRVRGTARPRKDGIPLTAYVDVALEHLRFEKSFIDDLEKLLGVQEALHCRRVRLPPKVKAADPASLADSPAPPRDQGLRVRTQVSSVEEGIHLAPRPDRRESDFAPPKIILRRIELHASGPHEGMTLARSSRAIEPVHGRTTSWPTRFSARIPWNVTLPTAESPR
jgi:DNA-binding Lrp family transcriptional regulator